MGKENVVNYIWGILRSCAITSCTMHACIALPFSEVSPQIQQSNSIVLSNTEILYDDDGAQLAQQPQSDWPHNFLDTALAWGQKKPDTAALNQAWVKYWLKNDGVIRCKNESTPLWERKDLPKEFVETKETQWLSTVQWFAIAKLCQLDVDAKRAIFLDAIKKHRAVEPQNSWIYVVRVHYWFATEQIARARIDQLNVIALDSEKKWQDAIGLAWSMQRWRNEQIAKGSINLDQKASVSELEAMLPKAPASTGVE